MEFELDKINGFNKEDNDIQEKDLSNREKNQLTASLIRKQIGDIEQVRISMGLNKRRMCELLLIDPSTWTRWTSGKTPVPPSVYRTLQWGLAVMDKYPEFHPLIISQSSQATSDHIDKKNSYLLETMEKQLKDMQSKNRQLFIAFLTSTLSFFLLGVILVTFI